MAKKNGERQSAWCKRCNRFILRSLQFQIAQTSSNKRGAEALVTVRAPSVNVTIAHSFFVARAPLYQEVRISAPEVARRANAPCYISTRRNVPRWISIHESGQHTCAGMIVRNRPRAPGDESLHSLESIETSTPGPNFTNSSARKPREKNPRRISFFLPSRRYFRLDEAR